MAKLSKIAKILDVILSIEKISVRLIAFMIYRSNYIDENKYYVDLPWREKNLPLGSVWSFHKIYANRVDTANLNIEQQVRLWFSYLDYWHNLCNNLNLSYIIKLVDYNEDELDFGLFAKSYVSLCKLSNEICGFLEEIDEDVFDMLHELGHPSLFIDPKFIDINSKNFSATKKYFILYGPLSLANPDMNQMHNIHFTNKCISHTDEPLLISEIFFKETFTVDSDGTKTFKSDIELLEHNADEIDDFSPSKFVYRVMFGMWDKNGKMNTDYVYEPNDQILVKYSLH